MSDTVRDDDHSFFRYIDLFTHMAEENVLFAGKSRRKIALVVGIGDYRRMEKLKNAVNDAESMATTLAEIGFNVTTAVNLERKEFRQKFERFRDTIQRDDLVLFYFAGHGIRLEVRKKWVYLSDVLISRDCSSFQHASVKHAGVG